MTPDDQHTKIVGSLLGALLAGWIIGLFMLAMIALTILCLRVIW